MSTLREVREELATAITGIVPTYDKVPASPETPFAVVMWPSSIEFNRTLGGTAEYAIPITVYVGLTDTDAGQDQLDGFVSGSIRTTIERRTTAVWRNVIVESVTNIRPEVVGEAQCLAADFNVTLIA